MTVKMMTGKQVNFLKKLVEEKLVPQEDWKEIFRANNIKKEEDLYHLNVEAASSLIYYLTKMPNK